MDMRTVEVGNFLSLISRVENNSSRLDANPQLAKEYTDDLKVKGDGYENRRGKRYFVIEFEDRK